MNQSPGTAALTPKPRVRFAPSPTGFLHVGSARTFIFNWLYARRNGGTVILRLDDTDVGRNTEASVNSIFEGLKWLNLNWDEEYKQSERGSLHRATARDPGRRGRGCSTQVCGSFLPRKAIAAPLPANLLRYVFACRAMPGS